jgi:xyloglucan-specific exo-beta-1,4-glucanase
MPVCSTSYNGNTGTFYRSIDGGLTWAATAASLPVFSWHKVVAMPGVAHEVWISLDVHGLWRSTDGGNSFTQIPNVQWARLHSFGKAANSNNLPILYVYGTVNNTMGCSAPMIAEPPG